jgi:hypothetical protein
LATPKKPGVARGCQIELSLVVVENLKELRRRFSRAVTVNGGINNPMVRKE